MAEKQGRPGAHSQDGSGLRVTCAALYLGSGFVRLGGGVGGAKAGVRAVSGPVSVVSVGPDPGRLWRGGRGRAGGWCPQGRRVGARALRLLPAALRRSFWL